MRQIFTGPSLQDIFCRSLPITNLFKINNGNRVIPLPSINTVLEDLSFCFFSNGWRLASRGYEEMSSILVNQLRPRILWTKCGGVAGSQLMSTAVYITWYRAQINFGDLPPYLTYDGKYRFPFPVRSLSYFLTSVLFLWGNLFSVSFIFYEKSWVHVSIQTVNKCPPCVLYYLD